MNTYLIIAATNRPHSLTQIVSEHYQKVLKAEDVQAPILSLAQVPDDLYTADMYAEARLNEAFVDLVKPIADATHIIWVIPQYHGSIPGVLKLFLDALPDPGVLASKRCALVGLSAGYQGNLIGLGHFVDILHYMGSYVYPMSPKLANMKTPTLEALQANPRHLQLIQTQIDGFIYF